MKIIVLGASGMIGSAMMRVLSTQKNWQVFGTLRSDSAKSFFSAEMATRLLSNVDITKEDTLIRTLQTIQPQVVINCIGLTKHHKEAEDPLLAIPINALLPHRLSQLCATLSARFIHISTDCIFSGVKGAYTENDVSDAKDVYGKTKSLGEVIHAPHAVTLRTSTIGHELASRYGLLEWFLSQQQQCSGFSHAIFSGLPTVTLAEIIRDLVIPQAHLSGLYNVGGVPINKYELLRLIAQTYQKSIDIIQDTEFVIDRSLNSERFCQSTGYVIPTWPSLIQSMYNQR